MSQNHRCMKKCIWIIVANRKILRDFFDRLLPPSMKELNTCKTSPIKIYTVRTAKKKMKFKIRRKTSRRPMSLPSMQFSKNCRKKEVIKWSILYLEHLKLLILEFQFCKILGWGKCPLVLLKNHLNYLKDSIF